MTAICFSSRDQNKAQQLAWEASEQFRKDESIRTLGPSQLGRILDEYRYRVVLKGANRDQMIETVWKWYEGLQINRQQIKVRIDVDPYVLD